MLAEVVVAVVDDSKLSSVLSSIHGAGLGHVARGIRSQRGDVREQLRRTGIPVEQSPEHLQDVERLLVINAAARSLRTADLLLQHGAIAVWIVSPAGFWREIDDRAEAMVADAKLTSNHSTAGVKPSAPIPNAASIIADQRDSGVHPE